MKNYEKWLEGHDTRRDRLALHFASASYRTIRWWASTMSMSDTVDGKMVFSPLPSAQHYELADMALAFDKPAWQYE